MTTIAIAVALAAIAVAVILARRLRHARAVASLAVGDEVQTRGGLFGIVAGLDGQNLWVEVDDNVMVRVARTAVAVIIEPVEEVTDAPPATDP